MKKIRMTWAPLLLATTAMMILPAEVSAGDTKEHRKKAQQERQLERREAVRMRDSARTAPRAARTQERRAPSALPPAERQEQARNLSNRMAPAVNLRPVRASDDRQRARQERREDRRQESRNDRRAPRADKDKRHTHVTEHNRDRRQVRDTRGRNTNRTIVPDSREDAVRMRDGQRSLSHGYRDDRRRDSWAGRDRRDYDQRENYRDRNHGRRGDWWRGWDRGRNGYSYRHGGYNRGYNRGYWNGYRRGFRSSWWYGVPSYTSLYYFGHWPYHSGFWHARASWLWHTHHHHYHYGDYCPGFDYHYDTHYSAGVHYSSHSDNVAGTILGGVIGGILGSEIDGGRDRSAGIIIGSLVGAAIGNAATSGNSYSASSYDYSYDDAGYVDDDPNRYYLEDQSYSPPQERRTCIEYTVRDGNYVCRKWEVEYDYND
ncbi:MAG: glycine zipper 2TM domain-containing protein [Alphaproteobacteria bacterium]|nr:glycine zipper 2TM domain-containing protein [Alphaproteobacteria bacterium]